VFTFLVFGLGFRYSVFTFSMFGFGSRIMSRRNKIRELDDNIKILACLQNVKLFYP
jgi:hypothetical protein